MGSRTGQVCVQSKGSVFEAELITPWTRRPHLETVRGRLQAATASTNQFCGAALVRLPSICTRWTIVPRLATKPCPYKQYHMILMIILADVCKMGLR